MNIKQAEYARTLLSQIEDLTLALEKLEETGVENDRFLERLKTAVACVFTKEEISAVLTIKKNELLAQLEQL